MKVIVLADQGDLLWSHEDTEGRPSGCTSNSYLQDGSQHKIIAILAASIVEASAQLRGTVLEITDVVADVGAAPAEVNRRIPISIVWDRDASR